MAAFIAVPLIEIAVFIQVGGLIGLWPTLAVVVITAVVGTWLLRLQGIATLNRARQQINRGAMPTHELFDGLCLVFAGALLLTPGFVTDAVGLALFVPAVRTALRGIAARYVKTHGTAGVYVNPDLAAGGPYDPARQAQPDPHRDAGVKPPPRPGRGWGPSPNGGTTIDGDFRDLTDGQQETGPETSKRPDPDRNSDDDPSREPNGPSGSNGAAGPGPNDGQR
ncbi:FxsA family protein [Algihabitans albus]|nr:FxsA family protein [Algihabitans albus]